MLPVISCAACVVDDAIDRAAAGHPDLVGLVVLHNETLFCLTPPARTEREDSHVLVGDLFFDLSETSVEPAKDTLSVVTHTTETLSVYSVLQQGMRSNNQLIFKSRFQVFAGMLSVGKTEMMGKALNKNAEPDLSTVRDFREIFHVVVTQEILDSYFGFGTPWTKGRVF